MCLYIDFEKTKQTTNQKFFFPFFLYNQIKKHFDKLFHFGGVENSQN